MTSALGRVVASTVALAAVLSAGGCGDGRPGFCDELAQVADLGRLERSLRAGDLGRAERAAEEFRELADGAPPEVRPDMRAVARGVGDLVALLRSDRAAAGTADAERAAGRREALERELGALSLNSSAVEAWARRECGLELGLA